MIVASQVKTSFFISAGCKVTPEGYAHMTHMLSSLANGRVIVALEGGYNLTAIAYSMTMCTKSLLGDPIPPLHLKDEIDPVAVESIRNVLDTHAEYWSVLQPFRKQFPFNTHLVPFGNYSSAVDISCVEDSLGKLKINNNLDVQNQVNSGGDLQRVDNNSNTVITRMDQNQESNQQQPEGAGADAGAPGPSENAADKGKLEPFTITVACAGAAAAENNNSESLVDTLRKMQEGIKEVLD